MRPLRSFFGGIYLNGIDIREYDYQQLVAGIADEAVFLYPAKIDFVDAILPFQQPFHNHLLHVDVQHLFRILM